MSEGRRSDRIEMALPLEVTGLDPEGRTFSEKSVSVNVARHGAMVRLAQKLFPEQELTLRKGNQSIEAVVVGIIDAGEGQYTYGLVFKGPERDFWGIRFPELSEADRAALRVVLECRACGKRELTYLNEVEIAVFQNTQSITRGCAKCASSTMWQRAEHDTWVGPSPEAVRKEEVDGRSIKRKHSRLKMRMEVCVRTAEHGDDVVQLDDISRGGFGFRSRARYRKQQRIEAATNYQPGGPNIFVPAKITSAGKAGSDGKARYGAAYVGEREAASQK